MLMKAPAELLEQALALRRAGGTAPEIAARLGIARSTAYRWTRHIPLADTPQRRIRRQEHSRRMTDAQWGAHRADRDRAHAEQVAAVAAAVGELTDRDVTLIGAAIYWCEGAKSKPWRPQDWTVKLTNSDPLLVNLFLRYLELLGRSRLELSYRLSIHRTADITAALAWWREQLSLPDGTPVAVTVKRHQPSPGRRNLGADYHGCIVVCAPRARDVYWRMEGVLRGLAHGLEQA
jgi:hypothetical protein